MAKARIRIGILAAPKRHRADALVIAQPSDDRTARPVTGLDEPLARKLGQLVVRSTVGAIDQSLLDSGPYRRLAVVSLGPADKVNDEVVRQAGGALNKWASELSLRRLGVVVDALLARTEGTPVQALCEGLLLADFHFARHRQPEEKPPPPLTVDLLANRAPARRAASAQAKRAAVVSAAVNMARELAHEPANVINPATLASRAKRIAAAGRLRCRVLDARQIARRKMGAILAVAAGSQTGPRLIVLEYKGSGRGRPVVLVGKAITFDTGGYSLKPPDSMVGMKYDKCGGVNVLAVMQAVAALKIKTPVVGVIASAENMVSSRAYRPNDIIRAMSGKTIEIISTDAEGRLVLADALSYAQAEYKPRAMIDLATLTGGVRVALGTACAGVMSNHDALCEALTAAGGRTHERLWRLPLWDDYREQIKAEDADIKNSGGRAASTITGGMFLKEFVDDAVPWAHLDIASVADAEKEQAYCPKGATGFGVRLLVEYLRTL